MTLREIWSQKTEWMPNQKGFHDAGHAGIMGFLVFLMFAVLLACKMPFEDALQHATLIGMMGGLGWEVAGKMYGESWASCLCDLSQFWMFTPISLTLLGNWPLAIVWAVILWLWYVVSLKKMYP